MKKLHLICNAHIDPAWLWDWEEGMSCALATFRSAVELADSFDYVFCHNEALLYEFVRRFDPETFARIGELVAAGKWEIVGGWYLQPDCTLPCGESLVRQIRRGRSFFLTHFGVSPRTAVSFDAFGHAGGLPQILRKTGYENYLCCRPSAAELPVPDDFVWEGVDGSRVLATRVSSHYNAPMGRAAEKIRKIGEGSPKEVDVVLWGVGNHGGGPSRKDLADISALQEESPFVMVHSTPDRYFAETAEGRPLVRGSLGPCMPGCYTSQVRIKQLHRRLESALWLTERMVAHAACAGMAVPAERLAAAERNLLLAEFHDILPGSGIPAVEEYGIQLLQSGLDTLRSCQADAFFTLVRGQAPARPGTFPVFVFNPYPYEVETVVDTGFALEEQNYEETFTNIVVRDEEGDRLSSQLVKEHSNLTLDWMKRVLFCARLRPFAVNRFSCEKEMLPARPEPAAPVRADVVLDNGSLRAVIAAESGLLTSVTRGGRPVVGLGFAPLVLADNADPWAMSPFQRAGLGGDEGVFTLMAPRAGAAFSGLREPLPSVRVVEDGEVCTVVESVFSYRRSDLRIEYTFYRQRDIIDLRLDVFWAERDHCLKLRLPLAVPGPTVKEIACGRETVVADGRETAVQRYVLRAGGETCAAVLNRGSYGMSERPDGLYLTLLRSAAYAAHPIGTRPLTREGRFTPRIDVGARSFEFRLLFGGPELAETVDTEAQLYNEGVYALNVFPTGSGELPPEGIVALDNRRITLVTVLMREDGSRLLRLCYNGEGETAAQLSAFGGNLRLRFRAHEIKTVRCLGGVLTEEADLLG